MKKVVIALIGVFILALCITVAKRMSSDAMAVVVGMVCGVAASIPTSLLMLLLARRDDAENAPASAGMPQVPNIMIVNPPMPNPGLYYPNASGMAYLPPAASGSARQFEILGEPEDISSQRRYF